MAVYSQAPSTVNGSIRRTGVMVSDRRKAPSSRLQVWFDSKKSSVTYSRICELPNAPRNPDVNYGALPAY